MLRVLLVAGALFAGACKGKRDDASCGAVASRHFALAHADLAKATVDPTTRRAVIDQLPAMRDSLTQICTDAKWSTQVRNCMVNASDHVALQTCQQFLTEAQRHALDVAARGETTSR
jgi:hypothetical protein